MKVRDTILGNIENTAKAEAIIAFLRTIDGKRFDKRQIQKLKEALDFEVRVSNDRVTWATDKKDEQGRVFEGHIYLRPGFDHTGCVTINADKIEKDNPAELAAARQRNAKRISDLSRAEDMAELEKVALDFLTAERRMKELLATFQDQYDIEKMLGVYRRER